MNDKLTNTAIEANIKAMRQIFAGAETTLAEAHKAIQEGKQNLAIGTLAQIGIRLEDALALYRAANVLHQTGAPPK